MNIKPFRNLVKLVGRAFYDDITTEGLNSGIAVIVLDALTRRQWVREDDLAKHLKLHLKQIRQTLQFLEEEKLVTRDHRKETANGAKAYRSPLAPTSGMNVRETETENKIHSYCRLDYIQIHKVVRYRMYRMKKTLKDELDNKNTVQEYVCPKCGKRYNALDVSRLISFETPSFHCESCNTELVSDNDKDGDDNARRRQHEKSRDLLQKLEVDLKPLTDQLFRIEELEAPDYGTLEAWELRASTVARASKNDTNGNDSSRSGQGGTTVPFCGDLKVEVSFLGGEEKGELKSEKETMKALPSCMIKECIILTNEQRGVVKQESHIEGTCASIDLKDDKTSISHEDDKKNVQDEYLKAYYAAILQRQKEQEEVTKKQDVSINSIATDVDPSSSRKRQLDDGEGDVEWEETPTAQRCETLKVEATGDDEDDDGMDWIGKRADF